MTKRITVALTVLFSVACFLFAQEKKDTSAVNSIVVTQQAANKRLTKQSMIVYKPKSNWSKIKDLFM
jgi:cell division protein FtsB